jgi:Protein of unknown function (DUF3999)
VHKLITIGLFVACSARAAGEPALRFEAPITVTAAAPFVQLPLPASAYGRSQSPLLADLRIVDAHGERVPFALLPPRQAGSTRREQLRDATLYPLPAQARSDGSWALPLTVSIQGDRIDIQRSGTPAAAPPARSAGWLFDLGERRRDEPAPHALRLAWSGPVEFSAVYRLESSDDLRQWRPDGSGQLLALASTSGALTQPTVLLNATSGRFVRLLWADVAQAPAITAARAVSSLSSQQTPDPPQRLSFKPSPQPGSADEHSRRALHFDLGGVLPLVQINLLLGGGTVVAPVRLQMRNSPSEPWRELASAVFYRLERGSDVALSPALDTQSSLRYLRVLPDTRAAALDAGQTQLQVHTNLASLVLASQGQPPYRLQAGAQVSTPSALPLATLVPLLDNERPRFGHATLGEWQEVASVAKAAEQQQQRAALRPWLLWAVLLLGVAGLGFMVWHLARRKGSAAGSA